MAELSSEKRDDLDDGDFTYIDSKGGRHLPIHDESHVRNAAARFDQTDFESAAVEKKAAAKKHDVYLSDDDVVMMAGQ